MSAQVSLDVRALFSDMGIEVGKSITGLVVERFEYEREPAAAPGDPVRTCYCRADVLEAA